MKKFRPDFGPQDLVEGLRVIEDLEIADVADLKVLPGVRELLAIAAAGALDDCDFCHSAFAGWAE